MRWPLVCAMLVGCESTPTSVDSHAVGDGHERPTANRSDAGGEQGDAGTKAEADVDSSSPQPTDDSAKSTGDEAAPAEPDVTNAEPPEPAPVPEPSPDPDDSDIGVAGDGSADDGSGASGAGGASHELPVQGGTSGLPVAGASGGSAVGGSSSGGSSSSGESSGGSASGGAETGGAESTGSAGSGMGGSQAGGAPVTPEPEAPTDLNPCPDAVPDNRGSCELQPGTSCYYDQVRCLCQDTASEGAVWVCGATDCPSSKPEGAQNCEGVDTRLCQYDDSQCTCIGTNVWQCRTCPFEPPEAGTSCELPSGACRYGASSCSCENGVWEC